MKNIFLFSIILLSFSCRAQRVVVHGIARDSLKINNIIGIAVNDTVRKFWHKSFEDKEFKNKNWDKYDELVKKFSTSPDFPEGNYTITAKITDTLYFYKPKYTTQKYKVADIIKNNIKVILVPAPCIPYKKCEQKVPSKLYAFVGKKIAVTFVDQSKYCGLSLDSKYRAEYKIEQELGDHYPDPSIIFTAYDHNSRYEHMFQNYDNILIFIGEFCGDLIQFKYQFFPVYKTNNRRWATPVDTYLEDYFETRKSIPQSITFDQSVNFDLSRSNLELSKEQIAQITKYRFPEKYYKIKNEKAVPIMGRYAEDLAKFWIELEKK